MLRLDSKCPYSWNCFHPPIFSESCCYYCGVPIPGFLSGPAHDSFHCRSQTNRKWLFLSRSTVHSTHSGASWTFRITGWLTFQQKLIRCYLSDGSWFSFHIWVATDWLAARPALWRWYPLSSNPSSLDIGQKKKTETWRDIGILRSGFRDEGITLIGLVSLLAGDSGSRWWTGIPRV